MKKNKKNAKAAARSVPQAGVYPDGAAPRGGAPEADAYHVKQAKDWGEENKK